MSTYVVCYDLHTPGQKYECLAEKLESYSTHWRIQRSVWIIESESRAEHVRDNLLGCLDSDDKLIVARLSGEAAWYGYSDKGTNWLKSVLGRAIA